MLTEEQTLSVELAVAKRRAEVDRLTGVGTIYALDSVLGECFREGTPFRLVLFDVAHFKAANEVESYPWADAFLARCGDVLRKHRGDGYAFRQGGDEFMIVLPRGSAEDAAAVRDRVETAVGVEILRDGTEVYIAGGIAKWEPDGGRWSAVVELAQRRMKRRKAARVF